MLCFGYCLLRLYHILRLILSLQDFAAAIPIIANRTFVRDNFALQVHQIGAVDESTMIVLPQVFVANLGDIDELQLAGSSNITDDDFQTFDDQSEIGGLPTAFANLPTTIFETAISQLSGNDTFRVCYTVFIDDVLFQLRNASELAEIYRGFGTGSIIISARVGSGPPPENITDPGVEFFFQKTEVCYISSDYSMTANLSVSIYGLLYHSVTNTLHTRAGCAEWQQHNMCLLGF